MKLHHHSYYLRDEVECLAMIQWYISRAICLIVIFLVSPSLAYAECDPKQFLLTEIENINYSTSTAVAAYSLLNMNETESASRTFDGSAIVQGAPINLSFSDAKNFSRFVSNEYSLSTSTSTALSYVKNAISAAGADAYRECLQNDTQSIRWEVDQAAASEPQFFLKVTWTPTGLISGDSFIGRFGVIGGLFDNQSNGEFNIRRGETISPVISRTDENSSLSVSISINGDVEVFRFPPLKKPRMIFKPHSVSASLSVSAPQLRFGPYDVEKCIVAEPGSFIFLSTAHLVDEIKTGNDNSHVRAGYVYKPNAISPSQVCLTLHGDAGLPDTQHEWGISAGLEVMIGTKDDE